MNKRGQDINLSKVLITFVTIILLGIALLFFRETLMPCPTCDCSQYENDLSECLLETQDLNKTLENRPIINNITYVPQYIPREQIDVLSSFFISIISLGLSIFLFIRFHLFKIEIKLPNEIEEEIKRYKKLIKISKIIILILLGFIILELLILII